MFSTDAIKSFKKDFVLKPLNEDDLLMPKSYISTGNYAVNKIISGSVFRGIPNNRITTFYGESGCVPFDARIYVMCKTEVEISEALEYVRDDVIFETYFENLTVDEKINILLEIGYTLGEICTRIGVTRQALWFNRRNSVGKKPVKSKNIHTSVYKLNMLLRKNVYQMKIQGIKLLNYKKAPFLVLTPSGFRRCSGVIDKGEKETIVLSIVDCPTFAVSKDHLVEMEDGTFEFAENIYNNFKMGLFDKNIKTIYGPRQLVTAREGGWIRMCDLEMQDPSHTYFANDVSGHNSGKSLIVSEIIINAIKSSKFDFIFYLDSEGGMLAERFTSALDDEEQSKVLHIPVENTEDCTVKLHKIYDEIRKQFDAAKGDPEKEPHVMVVLDSFSGLEKRQFVEDALNEKVSGDMGQKAKAKNAMIKSLMMPVVITGCPLVLICHSYKSMNAMGPQKFNELSGGEGIKYASHIVVQSTKSRKRQEDSALGLKGGNSYYAGNAIRYISYKDRLVKEGLETTMYVDLNEGISKYAGLWDDAIRLGFIKQSGAWYQVPSYEDPEKKFRKDDIAENAEIWNTFINDMDELFKYETQYGHKNFDEDSAKAYLESIKKSSNATKKTVKETK